MKVIGYARVSTEQQKKEGNIEVQMDAIRQYCAAKSFELAAIYADDGISATDMENRLGLIEMMQAIDTDREISAVIIFKLDRMARDLFIQEKLVSDFTRRNVTLVSINDPDLSSGDPMRTLIRQMLGAFAEFERALITKRMMAGKIFKAGKGGWTGGVAPFGYGYKDKELFVNPEEAAVVRQIFALRKSGRSERYIATYLNQGGVRPKRGRKWHDSTVHYLLKHRLYYGYLSFGEAEVYRNDLRILESKEEAIEIKED